MQSVNMQARVLQKQASPTEQILIIDLLNRLEPKKDRRRNSSKGIVDFNLITDENAVIVTEGRCKMEGVSVLGFSQPRVDTHKNDSFRSVVASLTENITLNFALETNFANYSSTLGSDTDASPNTYFSMPCSWAMPLQLSPPSSDSNTISSSAKSLQNDVTVLMVMERFLIYDVALQQSRLHLQEAFKFLMLGDEEQSKGPKSIAQVRKERESNLSPRVGDSTSNSVNHESTYSPKFIHNIDSVDQILGSVQDRARQLISLGVSASCYNIPVSLSDLTRLLNMDRKVAVIAVWTCRWHGKIRTGINFVRNVSPIPTHKEPVSLVSPRSSSSIPHPLRYAEDLLISLNHPGTLTLPSGHRAATTQVQVQLWNTGSLPLYITLSPDGIEPLSTISPSRSQDSDITSSLAALTVKVNDSADNITPDYSRRQQGMTWQGKTKYVGLELLPYAKMQVLFFVKFTSVGIYDLQR